MQTAQEAEGGPAVNDVFMGCSRNVLAGEIKSLQVASTPDVKGTMSSNPIVEKPQAPLFGLALKESESMLCTSENTNEHRLMIHYEMYTESSYSEVVLTSTSFSRKDCYDIKCVSEPLLQDMEVDEFDPLENGFSVVHISKGQKCFLDVHVSLDESSNSLPSAEMLAQASLQVEDAKSNRLILHPPSEVWGYDSNYLILGAVTSCHTAASAIYVWYRNGVPYKQGNKLCCVAVSEPGVYTVEVQYGEERDVSEPVYIRAFSDEINISSSDTRDGDEREESSASNPPKNESLLPVVEKEEILFSTKDEVGRGSFGVVYKGEWAGTEVAVKQIKLRNARRIRPVLETEVKVHSMIRHPNIVQIMAISFLKNSILLVNEFIDGRNLEELLFGDDEDNETFSIQVCDKMSVGKHADLPSRSLPSQLEIPDCT